MINVSVALPTWRSQHILWLQLESLCRQKNAPGWELLLYACDGGESEAIVDVYGDRLAKANCKRRICFTNKGKKVPLGEKWRHLARHGVGATFVFAASDDYSPPNRLLVSHEAITSGHGWADCSEGLFYNINTGDRSTWKRRPGQTGMWMAARRDLIANLEGGGPPSGIDTWMKGQIPLSETCMSINEPMLGLHTDGANTISHNRRSLYAEGIYSRNFHPPSQKVDAILPQDVYSRLKAMK